MPSMTALITGGRRGIGRACAHALAEAGFDIVINDIVRDDATEETLNGIRERGRRALAVEGDISDLSAHQGMIDAVTGAFGTIHCLVNNAGVSVLSRGDLLEVSVESYQRCLDTNLRGPFFLTQRVARHMLDNPSTEAPFPRTIINVGSSNAEAVSIVRGEYCVSKAGVGMMTKLFAVRLADSGIGVYEIRPGIIRTDMTAVAKELIKRDVLVLSMGCGNAVMQVAGFCSPEAKDLAGPGLKAACEKLGVPPVLSYGTCTDTGRLGDLLAAVSSALGGVPIPDIPVAAVAPEYMEQKATIDAVYALAMGLYTYVNPVPPVTGAPNLVKLLTDDCKDVTGGILRMETDAVEAVDGILAHIEGRRKKLGL